MKIVAVINDNTGDIISVLEEHRSHFPHNAMMLAESIQVVKKFGEFHEHSEVVIRATETYRNHIHIVTSLNHSFIYEDD